MGRVIEYCLREHAQIAKNHFDFMHERFTMEAIHILKKLIRGLES